jgi:twitching motility two-component system response regulator PilG
MTDPYIPAPETEKNILRCLKHQQLHSGNVDISVKNIGVTGSIQMRKGQVVAATCGKLSGNGALLTLVTKGDADLHVEESQRPVDANVSLSLLLVERLLSKLPQGAAVKSCDEEASLQQAIHLIFQFKRTEAGTKLVEVLRSNRFYYPAWLWHSRLMTRGDYLKRALAEARKWGNCDPEIQRESEKIEPQLGEGQVTVKRCIFCWAIVSAGDLQCRTCQGMLRITDGFKPTPSNSSELGRAIQAYEQEFQNNPANTRIAYCLCLGYLSLGNLDRAREYIGKALKVSPQEPIFVKISGLLGKISMPPADKSSVPIARVEAAPRDTVPSAEVAGGKTILMVEDSQTSRKVISMLLGRKGYRIVEAKNGAEALQKSAQVVPDLVLLDVMLPDMTGYEVLSRLRQTDGFSEVPVVMLTGKTNPSDRLKGLFHGSNEYLTKPFDPAKLLAVLEKYLEQSPANPGAGAPAGTKKAEPSIAPQAKPAMKSSALPGAAVAARKTEVKAATTAPVTPPRTQSPVTMAKPVPVSPPRPAVAEMKTVKAEKTVLVVEDSPTSRKVISMVLAKRGYGIEEAATGGAALRKMEAMLPNLILLDAMLPDMTGYDILSRLKKDERLKEVPVVMLTAKNNPVDRQKGLKGGSVAYLTKPFDPEKLLAVIDDNI